MLSRLAFRASFSRAEARSALVSVLVSGFLFVCSSAQGQTPSGAEYAGFGDQLKSRGSGESDLFIGVFSVAAVILVIAFVAGVIVVARRRRTRVAPQAT